MTTPILLQSRVDALVMGYQVQVASAMDDEVNERQALSDIARVAEFKLGEMRFSMKKNRTAERFSFENQDCRCIYDRSAPAGWNLEVVVRAPRLATLSLPQCLDLSRSVARTLGEVAGNRLRRADLAADYMNFALGRLDADNFFTTRSKIDGFLADAKDVDGVGVGEGFCEHLDANRQVTGVCIARGNPLSARVYNKRAELALAGREEKRAIEEGLWRRGQWTGEEPVTRVELQLRGEAIDSFNLRDPDGLESRLDGVWQYGVGRWMRLVERTRARRRECPLDPRWVPVAATVFRHPAEPAVRKRVRGGSTAQQALGTTLSRLGASGILPRLAQGEEVAFFARMSPEETGLWLQDALRAIFAEQASDCFKQLTLARGEHGAALWLLTKVNAKRAEYWSIDDLHEELLGPADVNGVIIG